MDSFRKQLKVKVKRYFNINVIISLIALLISFPFQFVESSADQGAGMEAWAGLIFLFHLAFLIPYFLLCSLCFLILIKKVYKNKNNILLLYSIPPVIGFLFVVSLNDFHVKEIIINIIPLITFFLGQIISLFLVLKFVKENKSEHQ